MVKLIKMGRLFYGIAMAGVGVQQFLYGDFPPMILPPLHAWIPWLRFWAWLAGAGFTIAGAAIIFEKKARAISLILGIVLFAFCIYYIPYEIILDPHSNYFGSWGDAQKDLALCGGAFVIAGSFAEADSYIQKTSIFFRVSEMLIPLGAIFFSTTMISFGIDHFLYLKHVAPMVPGWIPYPIFWTYFAAVALIASGTAIILKIKLKLIAGLLGTMILLWFILLHIPRAIAQPVDDKGSEVTSAWSALAFSGIAFVIGGSSSKRIIHAKTNLQY
jgi:uncharacterized membrane protein YphA (DoxX/SURF4 family)